MVGALLLNILNMNNIQVGDFEVLDSGTVTSNNGNDVLFTISDAVKIRLVFRTTEDGKKTMSTSLNSNNELEFILNNFDNPLGTEFTEALEIGTFKSRNLYFHARVLGMDNTSNKVIIYTFYLGGAINNG